MRSKCYAVLDTNVLVSALLGASRMSIPTLVLKAVTDELLIPLYNDEIINEYREVLSRKKFPFDPELIETVIRTIIANGLCLERTKVTDGVFPDPKDLVFYEVALSKEDSFLVTGNLKHFPKKPFVVSPAEMIQIIHEMQQPKSGLLSEPAARYGTKGIVKPCKSRFY